MKTSPASRTAVSGMDGFRTGFLCGRDDPIDDEIRLRRRRRADFNRLVGQEGVLRVAVGFGVHGHGLDPQFAAGADDPHGDLTAVGDQDL